MSEKISILAAPAHYQLNTTSEYGWTFNILNEVASNFPVEFQAITGFDGLKGRERSRRLHVYQIFPKINTQPGNRDKLVFIWGYWQRARQLLQTQSFDLIHHLLPFGYKETFNPLALFGSIRNRPFIVGPVQTPHSFIGADNPEGSTRSIISRVFARLNLATLRRADAIVAINEHSKKVYEQLVPGKKIIVIPPGIHVKNYQSQPQADVANPLRLLTVGALILRKGINHLINSLATVRKKHPDVHLDIIGNGPQEKNLKNQVQQLGLAGNVTFHGHIPHEKTPVFFEQAHIYCSASLSESFGQVYLESMACGKPVITTDNYGAHEIIVDGETGFLTPLKDEAAMAQKIIHLAEHAELRQKFGEQGRQRVEQNYDWSIVARKYFDLYQDSIRKKTHTAQ